MSGSNDFFRKTEELRLRRERILQEYDVASEKNRRIKKDDPAEKTVPAAPTTNVASTRLDSFSLPNIEKFLFKRNVSDRFPDLENRNLFQGDQAKDGAANVVQSTSLQFSDVNETGVLLASDGAPESLSDQAGGMRSPFEQNVGRNRPLMV